MGCVYGDFRFGLLDSDGLAGEDLAEIDFPSLVAEASAGCDGDSLGPRLCAHDGRTLGDYRDVVDQ